MIYSMAVSHKGKFLILHLLLSFSFCIYTVLGDSTPLVTVTQTEDGSDTERKPDINEALDVIKQQQLQLEKMEELVKSFNELLSRLEQQFPEPSKARSLGDNKQDTVRNVEIENRKVDVPLSTEKIEGGELETIAKDGESLGAVSVTKFSPFWSERFQFVSAVKLGSNPTFINVLPPRDFEGFSKYVAVGDDRGKVYLLARSGDVMVQFDSLSQSPVTAMVSFISVYKNESILVTGHEDGNILMHRVWEDSSGDEWSSLRMENIVRFDAPEDGDGSSPVTNLEVHHVGQKRYILSTDLSGKIRVFRDNGTVYGMASPMSRPLAFLKQRLLFLTETGAGSLDLRTMKIREAACEGLNSSVVKSYVFDATERSKAYGFTSDGDLIHVLLLGDIMNFKCRVRSKRKFDMGEPVTFQAIKGYLLIGNEDNIYVHNVSSQHYVRAGGPKFLFSAAYDGIISSFLYQQKSDVEVEKRTVRPIIASNHERLVILSLGGGYVAMFRSNLPVFKNEFNTMQWTSPVLLFILFLFGAWHFFAHKKDVLTSWGPDDPFSSAAVTSGAPLRPGSNDRSLTDSSRNADVVELRGADIRGTSRRYASPSRYPGGAVNSYRSGSTDVIHANPVSTSVEPNFLKNQELIYRGSNLENAGFPKRREGLYLSSQVVDEKS
ncbi:OLC1v1017947C1 [Oldenlandia corymbosa var. corymbosa]|uniref:OLC1v1017947C1 n=1 Tax=Oldenlandia corymbosa var. corymbosa TaxID=529605 RepID=A0AAV1EAI4_OLDCO|nr:OLC1v1017947C1 [Oldenlandia corymbosa var. corymbosa]